MATDRHPVIVDDLLSFLAFKRRDCSKEDLLKCIKDYYTHAVGQESHKILLSALPKKHDYQKLRETTSTDGLSLDPFEAIFKVFNQIAEEDIPLFVCKNLSNVPIVKNGSKRPRKSALTNSENFLKEHAHIKNQITEVFQSLYQLNERVEFMTKETGDLTNGIRQEDLSDYGDDDTDDNFADDDMSDDDDSSNTDNDYYRNFDKEESEDPVIDLAALKKEDEKLLQNILLGRSGSEEESSDPVYYEIKHVFDSTIGYFTIFICSHCQFYSNMEECLANHNCTISGEIPTDGSGIYDQLNFPKIKTAAQQLEELKLQQSAATVSRSKSSSVFGATHQCPICGLKNPIEDWLDHVRHCQGGKGSMTPNSIYCAVCDVFYADQSQLRYHMNFHDESKPYECLQCKFRFTTQAEVDKHFNRHIPEKMSNVKCPFCPFPLTKTASLVEHIRTHTGEKPFPCNICGASYRSKSKLKTHQMIHKRKQFTCQVCFKGFTTEVAKNKHMQYHSSDRPFSCPNCAKGFKSEKSMQKHYESHLQNFTCPHCSFRAQTADLLKDHVNNHIRCFLCDFSTCHKATYKRHMREKHEQDLLTC